MSAFGGKADIIQGKADIKTCPLMTQSGRCGPAGFYIRWSPRASAADRSRKSIFASIAQAGDRGLQASSELSPSTIDARTLLLKVGAAFFERSANLSELSKRH